MTRSTVAWPGVSGPPADCGDGPRVRPGRAADTLLLLGGVDVGLVLALAVVRFPLDASGAGGLALWGGRTAGLLAEVLVLAQVLLAARVPWLENAAGQDRLLRWHRTLGPLTLTAVLAHPLLLAAAATARGGGGWWSQLWTLGGDYLDAVAATVLIVLAGAASVRAARRWLPYEGWYLLHLGTYVAVLLAFGHQLSAGSAVLGPPWLSTWWTAQLVVAGAAVALYRVGLPLWRSARHRVRVDAVVRESADVVSVHLTGRDLDRLGVRGGAVPALALPDRGRLVAQPFPTACPPSRTGTACGSPRARSAAAAGRWRAWAGVRAC